MKLKIYKEYEDADIPTKSIKTDGGYDIYSFNKVVIRPGERELVPIGIRIIAPSGFYYTFAPRSGLAFKENVIPSHHNVMDSGYTGSCAVLMLNRGSEEYTINKRERFCQLILHKVPEMEVDVISSKEFNSLNTERGEKGMGSSGK